MQKSVTIQRGKDESEYLFELQREFCNATDSPLFIEESGRCPHCRKNIFLRLDELEVKTSVITSCPHCKNSFID